MINQDKSLLIFNRYLPPLTVNYCYSLWTSHKFKFIVSPKRATKLGDYRYDGSSGHHTVTVNGNLNPLSFLTTYIHEVAHLVTFKKYGNKVLPHGKEWKDEFKNLFLPLLNEAFLPAEAIKKLKAFLSNPRASSCSEHGLFEEETQIQLNRGEAFLKDMSIGSSFVLKKRSFRLLEYRRTRALCLDIQNGKKYLVPLKMVVLMLN